MSTLAVRNRPQAALVKGDIKMAGVLAKAVTGLRQTPTAPIEIKVDNVVYRLTPRLVSQSRAEAERRIDPDTEAPLTHNPARRVFISAVIRGLTRQRVRELGGQRTLSAEDEQDLRAELASEPAIRGVLDVLWPELDPQQLLAQLYQQPSLLDLTEEERAAIARPTPEPWTTADVPLLDELAELTGPPDAVGLDARRRRAAEDAEHAEALQYSAELVEQLVTSQAIVVPHLELDDFVNWIASRNTRADDSGQIADRARYDRTWAYGHVIVDEAQELSAMAWRMVLRRCPARSMTVVGDLAQTAAPAGADSWAQVLDPVAPGRWRTARLTVNYRTPKPAMALATTLLPPTADPPLSVRDSDEHPWYADADRDRLAELVRRETELIGTGRVAVIAPPARVAEIAASLGLAPGPDLEAPVAVLTPEQAKGLEFDSVIVADPAGIEQASPRGRADLYVALTRTTRRLGLVSFGADERVACWNHGARTGPRGDPDPAPGAQAQVQVADDLRLFLRPRYREVPILVPCDGVSTLGHVVQSIGVPLTEVGDLTVSGPAVSGAPTPASRTPRPASGRPGRPADQASVDPQLRPGTRRTYDDFSQCRDCGKAYWRGAHAADLDEIVRAAAVCGQRHRQ